MADWTVSPILVPLIDEVRAEHPGIVIGTIGDAAHTAEGSGSDHNPDQWGFVCAADPMIGPHFTEADAEYLFDRVTEMIRGGDKRPAFAIYKRRIVSSTVSPGVIRGYAGSNPHTDHVHISVPHGSRPHPTTSWEIYEMTPAQFKSLMDGYLTSDNAAVGASDKALGTLSALPWAASFGQSSARETAGERLGHIDEAIDVVVANTTPAA